MTGSAVPRDVRLTAKSATTDARPLRSQPAGPRGFPARILLSSRAPFAIHVASIAAAAVVLVIVARGQWFFFDEWTFFDPSVSLLQAHNGHLSIIPMVVFRALYANVGLASYWPYELLVIVVHLVLTHLLWRISIRSGASRWVATVVCFPMLVLGAGSEDLLWGFQIGFLGAVALGLGATLLVSRPLRSRGMAAAALLTLVSLGCSGTSLPLAVATIVIAWRVQGGKRTAIAFGGPAALFVAWWVAFDRDNGISAPPRSAFEAVVGIPQYVAQMYAGGLERLYPVSGLGSITALALGLAAATSVRLLHDRERWLPVVLVLTGVGFAVLTATQRIGLGMETASSTRYVYVVVALSLPLVAVLVSGLVVRWRRLWAPAMTLVALMCVGGLVALTAEAGIERNREQTSRQQMSAAVRFALDDPGRVDPSAAPDPVWAPSMTLERLLALHREGRFPLASTTAATRATALINVGVRIEAVPGSTTGCRVATEPVEVSDGAEIDIAPGPNGVGTISLRQQGRMSAARAVPDAPSRISNTSGTVVTLNPAAGTRVCR